MSDAVKMWIEERRATHASATDGPWSYIKDTRSDGFPVFRVGSNETGEDILSIPRYRHEWDGVHIADSVTDAHNNLPRALDALNKVLELHKPFFYYEHEDSCTNTDEDHRAERHVEFDLGEYYCEDLPTGDSDCGHCRDDDGERVAYPCPTVRALGSALLGADDESDDLV